VTVLEPRITLEQYAGVSAALAEGLPLGDVLRQEQFDEATYREAEPIWRERIADSVGTALEFTQKLTLAADCLARSLSPIQDDEAAWVGLLGAVATAPDQAELLRTLDISLNDIGRLGREWRRRAQRDPELGKRLVELAKTPTPPTTIVAGPVLLRPFPWTPEARGTSNRDESVQPEPAAVSVAPEVLRVQASFQLAAPVTPGPQTFADPDETLPIPAPPAPGQALPFAGTRSPEQLAAVLGGAAPDRPSVPAECGETALLPRLELVAAQTGSFRDQLAPLAIPVLSLDEYAELRARLTVYGEGDAATLERFGVGAGEVRQALRTRFAEYFQRDKAAQAQFITSLQDAIGRVRAERGAAGD